ncbi:aminopeptidase P family protein [Bradyrhizobium sp. 177]|uniref:M24 family metallopeptidase n=1 Tax=Bradyrhizobium sp. 177 TaxID=2782647 RepID=UPI001FF9DE69|nr:Xaa-Pro peptidase family protein [Bradyrhizobium sp. 177]MCK1554761.1 aminopeptidase P family protein [Bradyrhizobium sp. 177]
MTTNLALVAGFPKSEYQRREKRVLEKMTAEGLDALLVTAHGRLRYLSGYSGRGAYFAPFPMILIPGRAPTLVVREYEEPAVRAETWVEKIVPYTHEGDFAKACADVLRRAGVQAGRIGLELGCWNFAVNDMLALQTQLPEAKMVDATKVVISVAAVKSDLELEVMRSAMVMTDLATRAFYESLREGVSEIDVQANMIRPVRQQGFDFSATPTLLFGERTKLSHGGATSNRISRNDPAFAEFGAAKHGYYAGIVRSAVLGSHPEAESIHALAEETVEAAIAAIKPGATAGAVDAAARKVVERAGKPRAFRHRTGYQTGIYWLERGNISLEPEASAVLEEGMTLHMPIILFTDSGYMFGTSEHVLVTDRGAEILSRTPHALHKA